MRRNIYWLLLLPALFACSRPAFITKGIVVREAKTNEYIPQATLTFTSKDTTVVIQTNLSEEPKFIELKEGKYQLKAVAPGFIRFHETVKIRNKNSLLELALIPDQSQTHEVEWGNGGFMLIEDSTGKMRCIKLEKR